MSVLTYEDVQEQSKNRSYTREEFIDTVKRFVFRSHTSWKQGTYLVYFRNGSRLLTLTQLNALLSQITVMIVTPVNGAAVTTWGKVTFNSFE
jgi:hypothetical protein